MKKAAKIFSLLLVLMLLCTAAAAEEFTLPPVLDASLGYYTEADLSNIDRLQDQVAAYEAEIDMAELPDFDVYVFDNDYPTLEAYARAEAAMFGSVAYPLTLDNKPAWGYNSAELYDNEWYLVQNDIFELESGKLEEICWYNRTEGYAIGSSGITVHLPLMYTESAATPDLGIAKCFLLDSSIIGNAVGAPVEIDFIRRELPEALAIDDLVIDYSSRLDSMTELVTINGRSWYKIAGWVENTEYDVRLYSVLYLRENNDEVYGLQFSFPAESNGADMAIMNTTGF